MKSNVLLHNYLKTLRLPTFIREHDKVARQSGEGNKHYNEYLEELSGLEVASREAHGIKRRISQATFPTAKEFSEFEFSAAPKINKKRILDLSKGGYIEKLENIVLVGPPGVGKTHLAIALGREACRQGKRVKFFTAAGLVNAYIEARADKEVQRLERHIKNRHLIIVDELGYIPFDRTGSENLFSFFSQCYEQVSLVITTNLPFADWPQIVSGDERLAGALLDRLTHRVHVIEALGDSYRLKKSLKKREGGEE